MKIDGNIGTDPARSKRADGFLNVMRGVINLLSMDEGVLTLEERRTLLRLARHVIAQRSGLRSEAPAVPDRLRKDMRGVFVTLRENNELRGCIGYVQPLESVADAVEELAVKAAIEDPRFEPVVAQEVPLLTIDISVLTPLRAISSPGEVSVGTHGVMIEAVGRHGLLLPEVATEYGWTAEQFLGHCCQKAGLDKGMWRRPGTKMYSFATEHFSEADLLPAAP